LVLGDPGRFGGYRKILEGYNAREIFLGDPINEIEKSQRLAESADIIFLVTAYCSHTVSWSITKEKTIYINHPGLEQLRSRVEELGSKQRLKK
jgi:guanylate kinase